MGIKRKKNVGKTKNNNNNDNDKFNRKNKNKIKVLPILCTQKTNTYKRKIHFYFEI